MGDQKVLLRIVKRKIVPLLPTPGNQVGDQPRVLPIKVMVRKLQWQIDLISSYLMKAMEKVKRKSTSN
jgi:hypothetical protein